MELPATCKSDGESLKNSTYNGEPSSAQHTQSVSRLVRRPERLNLSRFAERGGSSDDGDEPSWHPVEGKRRSRAIDKYLAAEGYKAQRQFKVMLVGLREQKDILWKQTRLLQSPLTEAERAGLRVEVRRELGEKCLDSVLEILDKISQKHLKVEENSIIGRLKYNVTYPRPQEEEQAATCVKLYCDAAFQNAVQQHGINLQDVEREILEHGYFCFLTCSCLRDSSLRGHLKRVFAPDYHPTDHDWFHFGGRRRCGLGVREARVERSSYTLRLLDMTSGSTERKKWIHIFQDATCLVFVANLALYDQLMLEEASVSQLYEEFLFFDSLVNSRCFTQTPILLFLSNLAAFTEKLRTAPLSVHFPDYTGGDDAGKALEYLRDKYKKTAGDRSGLHLHVGEWYGAKSVEAMFTELENTSLGAIMQDLGITPEAGAAAA